MTIPGFKFGRTASLLVANQTVARDLSHLHFQFSVRASDTETPNTAEILVYNLKQNTVAEIIKEYTAVIVQAGYAGQMATVFKGTIKQFRQGRERNVDNFLEILAADSDELYNFGVVNQTVAGGSTYEDRFNAICDALGSPKDPNASGYLQTTGGILPRGKVLFGMGRSYLRDLARSTGTRWSFQSGEVTLVPLTGYLPGDVIVINSKTGMIGVPEATDQGVEVTVLMDPLIQVGQRVQINSADIVQTVIREQGFPNYTSLNYVATVPPGDGIYRVMVAEHDGDTRENAPWYTRLTCLAVDPSATPAESVLAYGGSQ
jgi:hypothetical protein